MQSVMEASSSSCPDHLVDASPFTLMKCRQRISRLTGTLVEMHITDVADPLRDTALHDPFLLHREYETKPDSLGTLLQPTQRFIWHRNSSRNRYQTGSGEASSRPLTLLKDVCVVIEEEDKGLPAPGGCVGAEHQIHDSAQVGKPGDNTMKDWDELGGNMELPAAHIFLEKHQLQHSALQMLMLRHASTLGIDPQDAAEHLPTLLAALSLIPSSPLRHLCIIGKYDSPDARKSILQALDGTTFLEGLTLEIFNDLADSKYTEQLCNKFRALGFLFRDGSGVFTMERLVEMLSNGTGKVKQLFLSGKLVGRPDEEREWSLLARLAAECHLTRLYLKLNCTYPASDQLKPVLDAISRGSSSLSDLGLDLFTPDIGATRGMCMMRVVSNSGILERLQVLRLSIFINTDDGLKMLAQGLTRSGCTVRFVDLFFYSLAIDQELEQFFRFLTKSRKSSTAFRALRLGTTQRFPLLAERGLGKYLRSSACSLVWLECYVRDEVHSRLDRPKEREKAWELAKSLTDNFSICHFSFPWANYRAQEHADSLISRNKRYKSGHLLKEQQVKPDVVKLFICGHAQAGKSTLCRALLSETSINKTSQFVSSAASIFRPPKADEPQHTRGMELHFLRFGDSGNLTICDLGGQEEFHVLHHYFMHASDNDLFIVVCKFEGGRLSHGVFQQQLQYWLRFIVSHRSKTSSAHETAGEGSSAIKPKVAVVVNFFSDERNMQRIAHEWTQPLLQQFSRALDFGASPDQAGHYPNLFGIKVIAADQVMLVKSRLEGLLRDFLSSARLIPKLCNDIAAKILPSFNSMQRAAGQSRQSPRRIFAVKRGADTLFKPYSAVLEKCSVMLFNGNLEDNEPRVKAALTELHNQGLLVFFPKNAGNPNEEPGDTLVILDSGWFCSKLIGTLLDAHLPLGLKWPGSAWAWSKEEVKQLLRSHGCEEEHLEEIVRYLQDLELCIPILMECESSCTQAEAKRSQLWFPALLEEKQAPIPRVGDRDDVTEPVFFGRRLRCKDSSMHLIPFGVFTRLQVRLHKLYGNDSFQLGNGWVSFLESSVGAVVRFGGDADVDSWESKQWIDIVILCPNSPRHNAGPRAGNKVLDMIKTEVYKIFQATDFRGIPTVMLQEWVLQSQTSSSLEVELSRLHEKVKKEGLEESHHEWEDLSATPVVKLLLPQELDGLVEDQLSSLAKIAGEYSFSDCAHGAQEHMVGSGCSRSVDLSSSNTEGSISGKEHVQESEARDAESLTGELRLLWGLIRGELADVKSDLQIIKTEVQKLCDHLRQAERRIIASCSTSLLRHELQKDAAHPLYPYLVDPTGKLRPLKALFAKQARLHFLCESREQGPHPVKGQKGKKVIIEVKEWLVKVARVMVPAFRVMCCLARIAATVYLPGAQTFIPSPDFLMFLGFDKDGLQNVILPKALEALLDQVPDVDYRQLLTKRGCTLQRNEVKETIQGILKNMEIDMERDFSLRRIASSSASGVGTTLWVCKQHLHEGVEIRSAPNPFQ